MENYVVIEISGGALIGVHTNIPDLKVGLLDGDMNDLEVTDESELISVSTQTFHERSSDLLEEYWLGGDK